MICNYYCSSFILQLRKEESKDKEENSEDGNKQIEDTSPKSDREKLLLDSLQMGDVNTQRIFCYQNKAPSAPESHVNPLRVVYSSKTPVSNKSGATRYIPTTSDRILDAPDIINDYCEFKFSLN